MKKILFVLLIMFVGAISAFAVTLSEKIGNIENNLFGYEYGNESDQKRIERIEEHLYGNIKNGKLEKRVENVQNNIGLLSPEETLKQAKNTQKNLPENNVSAQTEKENSTVEYTIVDKMEKELFGTAYKSEDIYNRLNRLEMQVFNKTSNAPLNDRTDKLANVVLPLGNHPKDNYGTSMNGNYSQTHSFEGVDDNTMSFHLAVIEQDLLKISYDNDNIANRLTRLENILFKKSYQTDNDINRMQRIIVAYEAKQKSYKYENNRKMQNMATMSQLGGFLLMLLAILL